MSTAPTATDQPANPLQLGQTLHEVLDGTIIATAKGDSNATFSRVAYSTSNVATADSLSLANFDDIVDARAVTNLNTSVQEVFVLTSSGLTRIFYDSAAKKSSQNSFKVDVSGLEKIIDFNPDTPDAENLLLIGEHASGLFVKIFDVSKQAFAAEIALSHVAGSLVSATLVRCQSEARLIVFTNDNNQLMANDLGSDILTKQTAPSTFTSLGIGDCSGKFVLSHVTAQMRTADSSQQIALAYPDSSGKCQLALLNFSESSSQGVTTSTLTKLDALTPDISFAAAESPVFRLAAGDVFNNGVDQLVMGYAGTYNSTSGCVCLVLLEYEEATAQNGSKAGLKQLSTYAGANTGAQPFCSIDLHLGVGLFGDGSTPVEGIVVWGAGSTLAQLMQGKASLLSGTIPVDINTKQLPPVPAGAPATVSSINTLATLDAKTKRFIAFPSDLTGQSVILGPPTLSQISQSAQILTIIQAIPYESAVVRDQPQLTFGVTKTDVKGVNVSSNKMWMFSNDTGMSIGIKGQTLGQQINKTYGNGFDKLTDHSTTTTVQVTDVIEKDDMLITYAMSYYVWTYPVFRKSAQTAPDGHLVVLFPQSTSPLQFFTLANNKEYGYRPQSQVGLLLSYVDADLDGYTDGSELFDLTEETVGATSTATLTYDKTKMKGANVSKTSTIHNTASDNAHFSVTADMFEYLPVTFGLNLTQSQSYSDNDITTTTMSHTNSMMLTFSLGQVTDEEYEYAVTPVIYHHNKLGCLMVSYKVDLSPGTGWAHHYGTPDIRLMTLFQDSTDKVLDAFSRDIRFTDNKDGTVDITVQVFNNSQSQATSVVCDFYSGKPTLDTNGKLQAPTTTLGSGSLPVLNAAARGTITLPKVTLPKNSDVTVQVSSDDLSMLGHVYWATYPSSTFAK